MQHTRRVYGVATALALTTVVLAGCTSAAKTLSTADFIGQADAICGAATTQIVDLTPLGANPSPAQAVTFSQRFLAIVTPALGRLAALKAVPSDDAVLDHNLVAPETAMDTARQMLIDNVQEASGDTDTEEAALDFFVGSNTDANQVTEDQALATFGFGACSHLGTGAPPAGVTAPPGATPPTVTTMPTTATTRPAGAATTAPFVAIDAGFSAVFPVTPTRQAFPLESDPTLQSIFYNANTADEDVSVTYSLHPSAPTAATIAAVLVDSVDEAAAASHGVVSSMNPVTYLGSSAEDAVITTADLVDYLRVLVIGPKFYLLQDFIAIGDTSHPDYDELLATFHTL
jgi:hypothetical protein